MGYVCLTTGLLRHHPCLNQWWIQGGGGGRHRGLVPSPFCFSTTLFSLLVSSYLAPLHYNSWPGARKNLRASPQARYACCLKKILVAEPNVWERATSYIGIRVTYVTCWSLFQTLVYAATCRLLAIHDVQMSQGRCWYGGRLSILVSSTKLFGSQNLPFWCPETDGMCPPSPFKNPRSTPVYCTLPCGMGLWFFWHFIDGL